MRITSFASGSSGNCLMVESRGGCILIDAGISMRRIKSNLALSGISPENISGVLVTHEHSDHVSGLATMVKYHNIPIYAPRTVANRLRYTIAGVEKCLRILPEGGALEIGGMRVRAFHTPHDTDESVGYRVEGDGIFALATDMGHVTDEIRGGLLGADAALIEANHDPDMLRSGPYPFYLKKRILSDHGHLSNPDCACLASCLAREGTRYIILGHLSRENNSPSLAFGAVSSALAGSGTELYVAPAAERFTLEFGGDADADGKNDMRGQNEGEVLHRSL